LGEWKVYCEKKKVINYRVYRIINSKKKKIIPKLSAYVIITEPSQNFVRWNLFFMGHSSWKHWWMVEAFKL
jgi:hypothetical protein